MLIFLISYFLFILWDNDWKGRGFPVFLSIAKPSPSTIHSLAFKLSLQTSITSGNALVMFSSLLVNIQNLSSFLCTNILAPSYLYSDADSSKELKASFREGAFSANKTTIGLPISTFTFFNPFSPFSFAIFAISP